MKYTHHFAPKNLKEGCWHVQGTLPPFKKITLLFLLNFLSTVLGQDGQPVDNVCYHGNIISNFIYPSADNI